jgi:type II secretory pathway pseudopilin PulG
MDALKDSCQSGRQKGFVLLMALVIMVIITLSAVAMITSLRGGISASGNIAFRQAATRAADVAVDSAFRWVQTQMAVATGLNSDIAAAATPRYYATMFGANSGCKKDGVGDAFTPQQYRFSDTVTGADGFPCAALVAGNPAGYTLYYVVHRMANTAGSACPAAGCLAPPVTAAAGSSAGCSMDPTSASFCGASTTTNTLVYYRITIKVVGPRQNNRYIQAFVY